MGGMDMKPCSVCGRVNPPEAVYCMTCGADLGKSQERASTGNTSAHEHNRDREEGILERVSPVVEDFAYDLAKAGAKLYFGIRDSEGAMESIRQNHSRRSKLERFKDVLAEARVEHRRRSGETPSRR